MKISVARIEYKAPLVISLVAAVIVCVLFLVVSLVDEELSAQWFGAFIVLGFYPLATAVGVWFLNLILKRVPLVLKVEMLEEERRVPIDGGEYD